MTKDLVRQDQWDVDDGMDGLDESDMVVPRLHIVQQASSQRKEDGGEEGHLFNALTKDNATSLRIIPLQIRAQRSNFPEGADRPICASSNGMVPDKKRFEQPVHHACCEVQGRRRVAVCPAAEWGSDGTPPDCGAYYELLAMDEETGVPFLLSLRGLNVKPTRNLISNAKLKRIPLRAESCEIKVAKVNAKNNTVYVVSFGKYKHLADDALEAANTAYDALRGAIDATQDAEGEKPAGEDAPF